jgi:hypothetical protein
MIENPLKTVIQDHTDTGVTLRLSLINITNSKLYFKENEAKTNAIAFSIPT